MAKKITPSECAERLKAIADPDRLRIVSFLQLGAFCVSDLAAELDMEISNVSHHLKVLRASGIVLCAKEGRTRVYQLTPELNPMSHPGQFDFGCCQFQLKPTWK